MTGSTHRGIKCQLCLYNTWREWCAEVRSVIDKKNERARWTEDATLPPLPHYLHNAVKRRRQETIGKSIMHTIMQKMWRTISGEGEFGCWLLIICLCPGITVVNITRRPTCAPWWLPPPVLPNRRQSPDISCPISADMCFFYIHIPLWNIHRLFGARQQNR